MRTIARDHLARALGSLARVPSPSVPAFRPLALVAPYLKLMERQDYDPFKTEIDLPQWRKLVALWQGLR